MMDDDQQFCLRWNNHQSTLISVFDSLLENETLVDCTLAAEGKILKAHKVVLSACSPYFATLLQEQYDKHPIFILKDVKYQELRAMMDYMYRGEVNISQDQLAALLKAAESLQIKGLSDSRSSGNQQSAAAPAPPKMDSHHRSSKLSGAYTVEQTKRARLAGSGMDAQDVTGSREGSSSPSRRRRKRRKTVENDVHDNSNSSVLQAASNQSILQQQTNAVSALVATQMPIATTSAAQGVGITHTASAVVSGQQQQQQQQTLSTTNVTKKTESVKGTSSSATAAATTQATSAIASATSGSNDNDNVQSGAIVGISGAIVAQVDDHEQSVGVASGVGIGCKIEKSNHKKFSAKDASTSAAAAAAAELIIEPKSEYDEEGNEETVEDLTLDDEEMAMDDLDQAAGTSQAGEGSSQGYATWQHDRSQEELLLATQDAQQRDPQVKHDKSEQTDGTPEEFELDDCLLESNDIVITQNKDGFVLHVKKLGNITTAKLATSTDDEQSGPVTVTATAIDDGQQQQHHHHHHHQQQQQQHHHHHHQHHQQQQQQQHHHHHQTATITGLHEVIRDVKPAIATLSTGQTIKLPSNECELINLKKILPGSTTIETHQQHQPHATATIIQSHQLQPIQQQQHHQHHMQEETQQEHQQQQHHQQLQNQPHHAQVQSIVTTHAGQTINLMGLRNVHISEQKPIVSRIKFSRGKIITPASGNVQIIEAHEAIDDHHQQHHEQQQQQQQHHHHHELTEGTKYEISEIDLNNPNTSAAIISDLVKYAEIDDIELPDGTKIGIGFAPTELSPEHLQSSSGGVGTTQITTIEHEPQLETVHHGQQHQHHIQTTQIQTHHLQEQTVVETEPQHHHHHHQHHQHHHQQQHQQQQQHHHQQQQHHHHLQLEQDDDTTNVETILPEGVTIHETQPSNTSIKSYTILTTHPIKDDPCGDTTTTTTYELSLSDSSMGGVEDPESRYVCRHCGKKYRWKSTLRRHENVECGGKEPCHPCPYCPYKAKQRGNLGVHVRKHHPEKPQLESKRGRKI